MAPDAAVNLAIRTNPRFPTLPLLDGGCPRSTTWAGFFAAVQDSPPLAIRVQTVGPITLAMSLRAAGVPPTLAMERAVDTALSLSTDLLRDVRREYDGTVCICASEPGLIGSMHPAYPLDGADVIAQIKTLVHAIDDADGGTGRLLIGAHVPGPTNWGAVLASGVSLVSMPVDPTVSGWAPEIADFLDRGGRIAWGAVPVDSPLGPSDTRLWRRLRATLDALVLEGVDSALLHARSLVSPVDGLERFDPLQAEHILGLTSSLADRLGAASELLGSPGWQTLHPTQT